MRIDLPVLLFLLGLLHSGTSVQFAQKLCRSDDDCDWDQCCVEAQTRLPGFDGICSWPSQKGQSCNPDPYDITEDGRYRISCPCDKGLSCQPGQDRMGNEGDICKP